jgi:hypothetical protein
MDRWQRGEAQLVRRPPGVGGLVRIRADQSPVERIAGVIVVRAVIADRRVDQLAVFLAGDRIAASFAALPTCAAGAPFI